MIINLDQERERRKLERHCNPSAMRDVVEIGAAVFVLTVALGLSVWILSAQGWR